MLRPLQGWTQGFDTLIPGPGCFAVGIRVICFMTLFFFFDKVNTRTSEFEIDPFNFYTKIEKYVL